MGYRVNNLRRLVGAPKNYLLEIRDRAVGKPLFPRQREDYNMYRGLHKMRPVLNRGANYAGYINSAYRLENQFRAETTRAHGCASARGEFNAKIVRIPV